jgi:hypothetical protein
MTRWEYRVELAILPAFGDKAKELNLLGEQGWELVAAAEINDHDYFVFKRPREAGS